MSGPHARVLRAERDNAGPGQRRNVDQGIQVRNILLGVEKCVFLLQKKIY